MHLVLTDIGKKYDQIWIFKHLTAHFEPNHIYGLVGHNGSGKSTLLQILSGFVSPNQGSIEFNHGKTGIDEVYRHISLCAPYLALPSELTVEECLDNQSRFKPFREGFDIEHILNEMELENHRKKKLNKLSSGMKQRLKLALAIFADSSLLLVDEPCSNLDSNWSDWFNNCIAKHSKDRTIVICSNSQENELKSVNQPLIDLSDFRP